MAEPFVQVPLWLLGLDEVTSAAKLVWGYLRDKQGENRDAYPGVRLIAQACALHKSYVPKLIAELEKHELLDVTRPDGNTGGRTNHYQVRTGGHAPEPDVQEKRTSRKPGAGRPGKAVRDVQKKRTDPIQGSRSRDPMSVRFPRTSGKSGQSAAPARGVIAARSRRRKPRAERQLELSRPGDLLKEALAGVGTPALRRLLGKGGSDAEDE